MPAKENVLLLSDSANQTILIRKDVDNLVQNIKENLKLTQYENVVSCPGPYPGPTVSLPDFSDYPSAVSDSRGGSDSLKARSYMGSRASRASPYGLVVQPKNAKCECIEGGANTSGGPAQVKRASWAARKRYPSMSANGKPKQVELEDPLEMLHELISEGNLLKEAVRRLQLGLSPKIQRNFYDSDEECRTPPGPLPPLPSLPQAAFPDLCEIGFN